MNKGDILTLYEYNTWANASILNATSRVTAEQFLTPVASSYGDLRGTLVHTLFAEWIWRNRWEGNSPTERLKPEDFPTFEKLQAQRKIEEKALTAFVETLNESDLEKSVKYSRMGGEPRENILWHLMVHLVNHGTQHRSEAATMLTEYGHSPGDIDFIIFLREME